MVKNSNVKYLCLLALTLVLLAGVQEASAFGGRIFGGWRSCSSCCGNSCQTRSSYSNYFQTYSRTSSCSTCNGFSYGAPSVCSGNSCALRGEYAVAPVDVPEPCEAVHPVETPLPCGSVTKTEEIIEQEEVQEPEPEPVQEPTCEPCGAVKAVETTSCKTCEQNCATCPIKTATKTALKIASSPLRVAVSELSKVNELRARYSLPALKFDAALDAGCLSHSRAMSSAWCGWRGTCGALYHAAGYNEIVAQNWGFGVDDALYQWEHSDKGHREILLNPYFTRVGIGCFRDASGRNWCTMRFK